LPLSCEAWGQKFVRALAKAIEVASNSGQRSRLESYTVTAEPPVRVRQPANSIFFCSRWPVIRSNGRIAATFSAKP